MILFLIKYRDTVIRTGRQGESSFAMKRTSSQRFFCIFA